MKYPKISKQLIEMAKKDQFLVLQKNNETPRAKARGFLSPITILANFIPALKVRGFKFGDNKRDDKRLNSLIKKQLKANTESLRTIIDDIGWPNISKVGVEGERSAWLIAQHSTHDVEFQKRCLELLKKENPKEIDIQHIAFLEDRLLVTLGKKQLYGTQFRFLDNGDMEPLPIKDKSNVDKRRSTMNMKPLDIYTQEIKNFYSKNNSNNP